MHMLTQKIPISDFVSGQHQILRQFFNRNNIPITIEKEIDLKTSKYPFLDYFSY